ncbi:ABC transporter substrate-binding protein [Vibrio tubiashii]|uniref:ABC transporter substrate-binding protein n=1 Tax=Vibrio tubiashii TaxID=29498 RepID=A0AAE5LGU6_9VIBR|nr:substrate-binding protein [Vibrio tubiashii]NOI79667.1 ABC transporter substrate-binding protein [Vibrio tubiashii]
MPIFIRAIAMIGLFILLGCTEPITPIKVGVVLPLTGTFSVYGEKALKGAQLAVEQINAGGGVNNRQIELIVRDNHTDPAKTVAYTRELIQQHNVHALLGPVSSSARYVMSELANKYQIPMLYGVDYEGGHYEDYLICYSSIPEHYIDPVIPYFIAKNQQKYFIFGYDYIWPHKMSQRIKQAVDTNGGEITGVEFTAFGVTDYRPVLKRLEASNSDVLMLILPGTDGFEFIQQFRRYPFSRPIEVVAFAADETYLTAVDTELLEGIYTPLHFFSDLQTDFTKKLTKQYRQFHGNDEIITYSAKAHYDLIYLLKAAIEKSDLATHQQVMNNLHGLTRYSGNEKIHLREDNHFDLPVYLGQYRQGELKVIKNFGVITPPDQRLGVQ